MYICSCMCTCVYMCLKPSQHKMSSSVILHLIFRDHLSLNLRLTDLANLAKRGDPPVSASQHWGLQAPATTSDFLYGHWRSKSAFQSNKSVTRKTGGGGCTANVFCEEQRGQVLTEQSGQSKQGSRWSRARAKPSAVALESRLSQGLQLQLASVGGVISGQEAKAASQRLSLGSWLPVTPSRPPVPFTMTKTGRYRKIKNNFCQASPL